MSLKRLRRELLNVTLIASGVAAAGFGLKGFLIPASFIDGGVTGVSMLLVKMTAASLSIVLPLVNLPFVAIGYHQVGRAFAIRSTLGIAGLAGALAIAPFPDVTHDLLLTSVFGGFFVGAGIGLAVRGGAVLDGTEIAALIISKRSHVLKAGEVILIFNVILFLLAMSVLGIEPALYSILTYLAAARTVDFVIYGLEEYTAVTIVSARSEAIRARIINELDRAVTIYKGQGGMSGVEQTILYCVVTRLEIGGVKAIVHAIDENAFVVAHPVADVEGGIVKRRGLH